ncbi:Uncharacterised protein [uncultured archaeon]|nr:Uncharacterised protein [uncultured archaeon]
MNLKGILEYPLAPLSELDRTNCISISTNVMLIIFLTVFQPSGTNDQVSLAIQLIFMLIVVVTVSRFFFKKPEKLFRMEKWAVYYFFIVAVILLAATVMITFGALPMFSDTSLLAIGSSLAVNVIPAMFLVMLVFAAISSILWILDGAGAIVKLAYFVLNSIK